LKTVGVGTSRRRDRLLAAESGKKPEKRDDSVFPIALNDLTELINDEQFVARSGASPPERVNQRKTGQRTRKRARRSRSNAMAKRGMHQRRNKRSAW
jgi:hypothetical protein